MGGGGGDSFQAALARQRRADAARAQRQVRRASIACTSPHSAASVAARWYASRLFCSEVCV